MSSKLDTINAIAPNALRIGGNQSEILFKHPLLMGGPLKIF